MLLKIIGGGNNNFFVRNFKFLSIKKSSAPHMKKHSKFQIDTFKAAEPIYNMKKKPVKTNLNPYFFCNLDTVLKNYKIF